MSVDIADGPGVTRLRAEGKGITLDLEVERPGHDALAVVVPWGGTRFQYTLKGLANPASGTIAVDGATHDIGRGWAVLDRGRGRWR